MAAATTLSFDYSQIGPLDWFEWRALLWDARLQCSAFHGGRQRLG